MGRRGAWPIVTKWAVCRSERGIPSGERQETAGAPPLSQNAIIQAALHGVSVEGGTIYITHQPCITCAKMIINSGIVRAVCANTYPDEMARDMLAEADVALEVWESSAGT
jgi:dCMP deaminase